MAYSSVLRSIGVLSGLLLAVAVSATSTASREPQVTLSAQAAEVPLDGTLALQVALTNPESEDDAELVIYRHMGTGVIVLARTREGAELRPEGMTHYHELCPPPPPRQSDFVRLDAGQFLGRALRITPSSLGIKSPGTYSVSVQYWVTAWPEGSEWRLSLRQQPIESAPITVTVHAAKGAQ